MPVTKQIEATGDYKVADMSLADFGRKELELAEHEMPGLMASRVEFGPSQPLAGVLPGSVQSLDALLKFLLLELCARCSALHYRAEHVLRRGKLHGTALTSS
eukprot:scaffold24973_cov117-Isochrysis_galbana.AAC.2